MRINSNKKIHKRKRDPYQILARMAVILAIVVVVGIGVFYLCSLAVESDYMTRKASVERYNLEGEQEFNAKMNELRSANHRSTDLGTGEVTAQGDLPFWEKTVGDKLWRIEDEGRVGLENTSTVTLDRPSLLLGGMLLVNAWHPLPSDYNDSTLVSVGNASSYKIQVDSAAVKVFPAAFDALSALMKEAEEAGMKDYIVRAGYRTNDEQTALFTKAMDDLSNKYSGDILIEQAKKKVNYPGTSEYQTGMSFQMNLYPIVEGSFQETPQGKWLTENAWKHGVIFRFPVKDFPSPEWEDKSYKTAVSTTLNLYRYVGKAHSVAMRIMDYCLEEYVEFLIDHPHICIYEDGTLKYEIIRINAGDGLSYEVPVPNPASGYEASLDNMGGIVMAYSYH